MAKRSQRLSERMVRLMKTMARRLFSFVVGIPLAVLCLFEFPFFLLINRKIFKNDIVFILRLWSFGHSAVGIDYASRLYYPHRISLIYIPCKGSNEFLPQCFAHNIDVFYYRGMWMQNSIEFGHIRFQIARFYLFVLNALTTKFQIIEQLPIYKTLSLAANYLSLSNQSKIAELGPQKDFTGYLRLLHEKIGRDPKFPPTLSSYCKKKIQEKDREFFEKPFVTLLLREKGDILDSAFRSSGPHGNYVSAVEFLVSQGLNVVGTGETNHSVFEMIKGYFSFKDVEIEPALLNLFLLAHCALFVGQQSGPHVIPNMFRIPCLICDALPHRIGTFCPDDLIVFKHLRLNHSDRPLSLVDVYKDNKDLAMGLNFESKNVEIIPNSPQEILAAVQETLALMKGEKITSPEELKLVEGFRLLPDQSMGIHYHGNRPPMDTLRNLKSELLK